MAERRWEVGICGTFDVANYGDLLFPYIAEFELGKRLGEIALHRLSYQDQTRPAWPYEVTSVARLPELVQRLHGMLIGGGYLIRFDKYVAPGYGPPAPEIHHPTGYWLTPALLALQHNVPLVWNAPGMHCNELPEWSRPLLDVALKLSPYVSVRDVPSQEALQSFSGARVEVVPDTGFGLAALLNLDQPPSAEFVRISDACGLRRPYLVLQANLGLEGVIRAIKSNPERFRDFQFLALPISPGITDRAEIIDADLPGVVRLKEWPTPLVTAELIGRSEAVFGHSYHLCITALASGVPVFTRVDLTIGKYTALQHFETIFALPDGAPDVDWLLARVGRTAPSAQVGARCEQLVGHWDRIAAVIREGPTSTGPSLDRLWQALPGFLETEDQRAVAAMAPERAEFRKRLEEAEAQLAEARRENAQRQREAENVARQLTAALADTAARDARIAEILASISWRLTAPVRFIGRPLRKHD